METPPHTSQSNMNSHIALTASAAPVTTTSCKRHRSDSPTAASSTAKASVTASVSKRARHAKSENENENDVDENIGVDMCASAASAAGSSAEQAQLSGAYGIFPRLSKLPTVMITYISNYLEDLEDVAHLAESFRSAQAGVSKSDAYKGRAILVAYDQGSLLRDPLLREWQSRAGLCLLGKRLGVDADASAGTGDESHHLVTPTQLRRLYSEESASSASAEPRSSVSPTASAASSASASSASSPTSAASAVSGSMSGSDEQRIILLRRLTILVHVYNRGDIFDLFVSGRLHLDRFDSCGVEELRVLLHEEVSRVLRSGWMSEDILFKLHHARDRAFSSRRPENRQSVLQDMIRPVRGEFARLHDNLIRLSHTFLPFTEECIGRWNEPSNVVNLSLPTFMEMAQTLSQNNPGVRFTLHAMLDHFATLSKMKALNAAMETPCRQCVCVCNPRYRNLCQCDCVVGCKKRRVERFVADVTALYPKIIGTPPLEFDFR